MRPLVALIWQNAIAAHFDHSLGYHRFLVFTSVWLGYSADRWLDTWRNNCNLSRRHLFHASKRWTLFAIWIFILSISMTIAILKLSPELLRNGFALALLSIVATVAIQTTRAIRFKWLHKSLVTALLMSLSILLSTIPNPIELALDPVAIMLSAFTFNCSLIHFWEASIDNKQEREIASSPRNMSLVCLFSITLTVAFLNLGYIEIALYSLASALLLGSMHCIRDRIPLELRRTLADIALFTPLAALV